jgi:hypothetical protein
MAPNGGRPPSLEQERTKRGYRKRRRVEKDGRDLSSPNGPAALNHGIIQTSNTDPKDAESSETIRLLRQLVERVDAQDARIKLLQKAQSSQRSDDFIVVRTKLTDKTLKDEHGPSANSDSPGGSVDADDLYNA